YEVISTARLLFSAVQDAETGERGYVVSQEPGYLQPYREATARIPQLVGRLRELTRDSPAHQKRLAELSREIGNKLAALARTIEGIAAWDAGGRLQAFNQRFFEQLELPHELAAQGTRLDAMLARDAEHSSGILQAARARAGQEQGEDVMFHGKIGQRTIE